MLVAGSLVMIGGAVAISFAEAPESERVSWHAAMTRECERYGLDAGRVAAAVAGDDPLSAGKTGRRWWEYLVAAAAVGIFVWLASLAARPSLQFDAAWGAVLTIITVLCIVFGGVALYRRTRFS
jgi:amino acid transporter